MENINYEKIILPIIEKAGKTAKKNWEKFKRQESQIKDKKEIVTETDRQIEKILEKNIGKIYPSHSFLGEEFGLKNKNSNYVWIIDPIDGTTNFSMHSPLWSISVALSYKEEIIFGAVYIPVLEEMFWAAKDKGAYLNNKKIELPSLKNNKKLLHAYCHGGNKRDLEIAFDYYKHQKMQAIDCRQLGSAAIELAYVAVGRLDSILIPGANVWDVAGGVAIAKEVGISVVNFFGKKWSLNDKDIIVCHPKVKKDLVKTIQKITNK